MERYISATIFISGDQPDRRTSVFVALQAMLGELGFENVEPTDA